MFPCDEKLMCWKGVSQWERGRLFSVHLARLPPTTFASVASDSCVKWGKGYKAMCKKPVHKFWHREKVQKQLVGAWSTVEGRGVVAESNLRGRGRFIQELEIKTLFKSTFQGLTTRLIYFGFELFEFAACEWLNLSAKLSKTQDYLFEFHER